MKNKIIKKHTGWGLIETLLTLGTISALSVGIYMTFAPTDATAKTKSEQENLRMFAENIGGAYGLLNNYGDVTNSKLISEKLVPNRLVQNNELVSSWGSNITITPYRVIADNDAFIVNYLNTPKEICNRLAAAGSSGAYDVLVNGTSILEASRKGVNIINTTRLCGDGAELSFVFTGNGSVAYAADPLDLPPPPTSVTPEWDTPITNVVPNPGDVPDATVPPAITTPTVPAPATPSPALPTTPGPVTPATPVPPVTPSNPSPPPTVGQCVDGSESQVTSCPAGTWGLLNQTRVLSCGGEPWTPMAERVPLSWVTNSGACATCPSPTNENQIQWLAQNLACPAGSYGVYQIENEQQRSRSVGYNCPAGTTTLPAPSYGGWSGWSNTGASRVSINTCSSCPAPSTQTNVQWLSSSATCPVGQTGSNTWEREQIQSRSVSYTCPSGGSSLPAPNYGSWSGWSDTGNVRNASNTCAPTVATGGWQLVSTSWYYGNSPLAYYDYRWTVNGNSGSFGCSIRYLGFAGQQYERCSGQGVDLDGNPVVEPPKAVMTLREFSAWASGKPYTDMGWNATYTSCTVGDVFYMGSSTGSGFGSDEGYDEYQCVAP